MSYYELRVRAHGVIASKVWSFHLDLETPVSLTSTELQDIVDTATTEWQDAANRALYTASVSLMACTIQGFERFDSGPPGTPRWVRKPTTIQYVGAAAEVAGTAAGDSTPPQIAVVVSLKTASVGRRFLGKCYTFCPPEAVVNSAGQVSDYTTRADMVRDIAAAAEGAIAPVDVDHVVYSVLYDEQAEVISYVADAQADTMRPRVSRQTA